jgi:hypothetical protein
MPQRNQGSPKTTTSLDLGTDLDTDLGTDYDYILEKFHTHLIKCISINLVIQ